MSRRSINFVEAGLKLKFMHSTMNATYSQVAFIEGCCRRPRGLMRRMLRAEASHQIQTGEEGG